MVTGQYSFAAISQAGGRPIALFSSEGVDQEVEAVRSFVSIVLIVWFSGGLLGGFAQNTTPRSGFAIVTLLSGNIAGLVGTETLRNRTSSGIEQAAMPPSPLITTASIPVPVGVVGENTTAIAIANPSAGSGGVNLVLTDNVGNVVLNVVVQLGPRRQFAKFLNELFGTQSLAFNTPLLLTVSSEIPVSIVALNFRGEEFTSIPLVSLSPPTPVAVQPLTGSVVISPVPIETCLTPPVQTFVPPSASNGFGLGVVPLPTPVITCLTPAGVQIITPPSSSTGVLPGFGLGVPPTPPPAATFFSPPFTISNSPVPTVTSPTTTTVVSPQAPTTASIGGNAALVFPQVVTGGAWSTDIVLGNSSTGTQVVRIDFFSSDGLATNSLTDIAIPPRGVFFFSSETSATTGN